MAMAMAWMSREMRARRVRRCGVGGAVSSRARVCVACVRVQLYVVFAESLRTISVDHASLKEMSSLPKKG